MNKLMEDKRTMFSAVLSLLEKNNGLIAGVAGFANSVVAFKELLRKIDIKAKERDEATSGKTANKHAMEENLIAAVMQLSSALFLYARKQKDFELRSLTDFRETFLRHMRDTDLATKADAILILVNQYIQELAAFGVTAQEAADFGNKIAAYRDAIGKSASSIPERKGARETLEALIREADEMLGEELDRFMERLRANNPEFYAAYCDATYLRLMGIRHEKTEAAPTLVSQPMMAK